MGNYLAKAAVKILPERPEDKADQLHLEYLTPIQISSKDGGLGVSAIYVDQMQHELRRGQSNTVFPQKANYFFK